MSYCDFLFLGNCKTDDSVHHYFEFVRTMNVDVNSMLNIRMDGSSVNEKFQKKNLLQSQQVNESCICPLHTVDNSFVVGMASLRAIITLDQFAIDLHFNYSAARREDLHQIGDMFFVTFCK